ncbi:mannose-1-phosphate guanylyltransferase/mannose-6-phosphate isomerase [Nitrospina sp. 32_T5]|uniref:mannose-1-phosphate guanylyltransferase/mannose-6-phosphate isomerase n=1 Tax=unclassified Nitrospina TaxID=2638683 RepID=UPI003F9DBC09
MIVPVILSGGAGTRLWPLSREDHPKPFLAPAGGDSLLRRTFDRVLHFEDTDRIVVAGPRHLQYPILNEYAALPDHGNVPLDFILEPMGRNTAPAIALAALYVSQEVGPETVLFVLAADQHLARPEVLQTAVATARELAENNFLVTIGIEPERPETGYGYIELGDSLEHLLSPSPLRSERGVAVQEVTQFVEKPDRERAEAFVASGRYLWNAGMFCFRCDVFMGALLRTAPEVHDGVLNCWEGSRVRDRALKVNRDRFQKVPSISVDYAVMEKARQVAVVRCDPGWDDLGNWEAVARCFPEDEHGNRGEGDILHLGSEHCFVQAGSRLVAVVGMKDAFVIDTEDALLVADRDHLDSLRKVVAELKKRHHPAGDSGREVIRPWGRFAVVDQGEGYQVKRIVVAPGGMLSLQLHHHRLEHWVIVQGECRVILGETEQVLSINDTLRIPPETRHRVTNCGDRPLIIIEVSTGPYLGEDDIVRFADIYGRVPPPDETESD